MPKPMLRRPETASRSDQLLSTAPCEQTKSKNTQMDKMRVDRLLRKRRSQTYMDAMTRLDAGGHTQNQKQVEEILCAIREEFPEIEMKGVLLGVVSVCYLGRPYEVHTLDIGGNIIEHYRAGEAMPGNLEKARGIALRGGYAFIEVYVDCCRAIGTDGAVSFVPG